MTAKVCTKCKENKPLSEFWKLKKSPDGHNYQCADCLRNYHRHIYHDDEKRRRDVKRRTIEHQKIIKLRKFEYIQGRTCADCGNADVRTFEFDHVRGKKRFNISAGIGQGLSWATILQEIAKCDLVCANCHRIRTWERRQQGAVAKSG